MISTDALSSGRDAPARRWPAVLVGGALVLAALAYLGNRLAADRELDQLLSRAAQAQATADYADRRVAAAVTYASPQLSSTTVPARVQASLEQLVEATARARLPELRAARSRVEGTPVLPWHPGVAAARRAYLSYLDARVALLTSVAADLQPLYRPHPELPRLLAAARAALIRSGGSGLQPRVRAALG